MYILIEKESFRVEGDIAVVLSKLSLGLRSEVTGTRLPQTLSIVVNTDFPLLPGAKNTPPLCGLI